jgi:single-stranded DNA-binding protein
MNYVSMIGTMEDYPVSFENQGKPQSRFRIVISHQLMESNGKVRIQKEKHDVLAWGKWNRVLSEYGSPNLKIALEGRLVNRYIRLQSRPIKITEIEINDLVIL